MDWLTVDLGPGVTAHVTTRAGGVSVGPHASLDLAYHVDDEESAVSENRARLAAALGMPVVYANQVHGRTVALVQGAGGSERRDVGDADALVTDRPGLALAVMVADCLPILLADTGAGGAVVGAVHAGRRGLVDGVLPAAIAAMAERGARPPRVRAYIGPGICGRCYEVGAEVQAEVTDVLPQAATTSLRGRPAVDLVAGALVQLRESGVGKIRVSGLCTVEDERFYSYRRSGRTGRFAGVVGFQPRDTP